MVWPQYKSYHSILGVQGEAFRHLGHVYIDKDEDLEDNNTWLEKYHIKMESLHM